MIKQALMVWLLSWSVTIVSAQNVHYYKLTRKMENGKSSTNVSGGQYITFIADICYESNKKGIDVGHGNMTRNKSYSTSEYTTYFGSNYWGKDVAAFKFNADKSVLNVVIDKDNYYIYKRATAPVGQETCSLIRKPIPSNDNGGGGTIVVTPPPVNSPQGWGGYEGGGSAGSYNGGNSGNGGNGTTTTTQTHGRTAHQVTKSCPLCHGSGKCNSCNGTHRINYQFGSGTLECPNCRPNGACSKCGGSGKITTTEWY